MGSVGGASRLYAGIPAGTASGAAGAAAALAAGGAAAFAAKPGGALAAKPGGAAGVADCLGDFAKPGGGAAAGIVAAGTGSIARAVHCCLDSTKLRLSLEESSFATPQG